MEAKVKLLHINADWRERYENLVRSGLIPDSLFWADKQVTLGAYQKYLEILEKSSKEHGMDSKQKAASVLRRIRGVAEGKGEVKFRLTTEIISAIYANLPRVKELHDEFVGSKMLTEKEFWTQFCTSKTFGKELGVGEEFVGKEGNIFDRAFDSEPIINIDIENVRPKSELVIRRSGAVSEGNELLEQRSNHMSVSATIQQINRHSTQLLGSDDVGVERISKCQVDIQESLVREEIVEGVFAVSEPIVCQIRPLSAKHDPEFLANMKLLPFNEFREKVMGQPAETQPFRTIAPSDFADDHFELSKQHYKDIMHLLRIYWRSQPMNSSDKKSQGIILLSALDKLVTEFGKLQWPESERSDALALLTSTYDCIAAARQHFDNKR